ncbi:hypothetical protein UFOVP118_61 [uncultured Caudovirales phage]|uniref:Uncharacterized protein n=1 Tax=uncultured Caudovirales phage TaxID=2100421 RepID=A0A6J5L884_9CAUD|nr:hypothetical protein UFOVP118_61 [uncultured Caudovirales phage]
MSTFTSPFTGTVVEPTDVSYYALSFTANTQLYWPAVVNPTQVPAARIMDCATSVAGLKIFLPQGNQGSVGSDILFRNTGSVAISIVDFSGDLSVTLSPGIARYFYLSDNTTEDGVWQNVTFGAGTSTADAASLQGAGLTTLVGKLAVTSNVVSISSVPTLNDNSRAVSYVWTSGAGTIPLPVAATITDGWWIGFRNGGTGTLTFTPTSPSTINGQTSININPNNSGFIYFQKSTGNYFTLGFAAEVNTTLTSATYDVDSIVGSSLSLVANAPNIQNYVALSGTRTTNLTVTLPNITQMYALINATTSAGYSITFVISGTSASITLPAGQVAVVVASGNALYIISQTTTNIFYGPYGSASVPTFSFTLDSTSGMYMVGSKILALSANATNILTLNGTNTSSLQVSTPATFNAALISGGSF